MPNNIPTPRSYPQVLGDMIDAFTSLYGIPQLKVGSPVLSILESAAQSDLRSSQDIFALLKATTLDNATGVALDRLGSDEGVPRIVESAATGAVTVTDTSFTKVSSRIYQGGAAPIVGSIAVNVTDASSFPNSGSIYVGRGTGNYEGPLAYSSKTNHTTYWTLNLTGTTARYHNLGETVILAQGGDRLISAGTVVQTPQGNATDAVQFSVVYGTAITDGETGISNVTVVAKKNGVVGNVAAKAIKSFVSAPFSGATVSNALPFTTATSTEDDDTYRERIRSLRASRLGGTSLALVTYSLGVIAADENKRVATASIVNREGYPTVLYIDDGTGYEEVWESVALEPVVDLAVGGEQFFQVASLRPVTKALVETTLSAPFDVSGGQELSFSVGGTITTHTFATDAFNSNGSASAYEVVASINADATLGWSARTAGGGTKIVVFAKAETDEDIQNIPVEEGDANGALGLSTTRTYTLRLFKNDRLLVKDGGEATISSAPFALWGSISGTPTIVLDVDGTGGATPPTYTFTAQDFVDAGTGFTTVGRNTPTAWAAVFEHKIPGISASLDGTGFKITSNRGAASRASLRIVGGTLTTAAMFTVHTVTGKTSDFTLDRNLGQIQLTTPLATGDRLTLGTEWPRSFVESSILAPTTLASTGNLWFSVDGGAQLIPTALNVGSTLTVTVSAVARSCYHVRLTGSSGDFANVRYGDQVALWDPAFDTTIRNSSWYVAQIDSASHAWFEIEKPSMNFFRARAATVVLADGRILVTGGVDSFEFGSKGCTASCEIFDPATSKWTVVASMTNARFNHTATAISGNKVFVFGGEAAVGPLAAGEVYDVGSNTWSAAATASQPAARTGHAAVLMSDGKVMIIGGADQSRTPIVTCGIYDGAGDSWASAQSLGSARAWHTASLLTDNTIIAVAGETTGSAVLNTSEIYDPGGNSWSNSGTIQGSGRQGHRTVTMGDGSILVVGGSSAISSSNPVPIVYSDKFSVGGGWTHGGDLNVACCYQGLVRVSNNKVVSAFGARAGGSVIDLYDGGGNTWSQPAAGPKGNFTRQFVGGAVLTGTNKAIFFGGGFEQTGNYLAATAEIYDVGGGVWSQPDPSVGSAAITATGLAFVRAGAPLVHATVPAASSYTATGFTAALSIAGAKAATYQTSKLRVSTNTYALAGSGVTGGDIALVTADAAGQRLGIPFADAEPNLNAWASVESGTGDASSPAFGIGIGTVRGSFSRTQLALQFSFGNPDSVLNFFGLVRVAAMRSPHDVYNSSTLVGRYGRNAGFVSLPQAYSRDDRNFICTLKTAVDRSWIPGDRLSFRGGFSLGAEDNLAFIVDGDTESKRFTPNMFRRIKPVGTTYGLTNAFKDLDASGASLAVNFGLSADFSDFLVLMKPRAKTHDDPPYADTTKTILWRYWRYSLAFEPAKIRYVLPQAPSLPVAVTAKILGSTASHTDDLGIDVALASGALKTGYRLRASAKIGVAIPSVTSSYGKITYVLNLPVASAQRAANNTTLTLTLPSGITNHGFAIGNVIFFNATDPAFTAGVYTITGVTPTTITFVDAGANVGPNADAGVVSYDNGDFATLQGTGGGVNVGDFFRVGSSAGLASSVKDQTIRISATDDGFIQGQINASATSATLAWSTLGDLAAFQLFSNPKQSATVIAAAVNALAAVDNSTCPVTAKVIGNGTGQIDRATAEEKDDGSNFNGVNFTYALTDALQVVSSSTAPGSVAGDYSFTFKGALENSGLATDSDWSNEVCYLVPNSLDNIVQWLNTPAVCGAFNSCTIRSSSRNMRVQIATKTNGSGGMIQVQGGTANGVAAAVVGSAFKNSSSTYASIRRSDMAGIYATSWVTIQNSTVLPKGNGLSGTVGILSTTSLTSIAADGTFTFGGGQSLWQLTATPISGAIVQVERNGFLVGYRDTGLGTAFDLSGASPGDWVYIAPPASPTGGKVKQIAEANAGIFRVVTFGAGAADGGNGIIWLDNANAIDDEPAECDIRLLDYDSIMPGDTLHINTTAWGSGNVGAWTVKRVGYSAGQQFVDGFQNVFEVDIAGGAPTVHGSASALGSRYRSVQIVEGAPARSSGQIQGMMPNQTDGSLVDLKLIFSPRPNLIAQAAGSVVQPVGKLNFPTTIATGADAYAHTTGLVGEVTRVLYGDARDPATYPGYLAEGASVNVSGPLVKKITLSLQLRARTGITLADLANNVRSVVAGLVNETGVGQSIALSSLVAAASRVPGVVAVTMISPAFTSANDLIAIQPFEKPLVLNLETDVAITFAGA